MSKRINEVVVKPTDLRNIMEALAAGFDTARVQDELQDLGLDVELDTIDWGNQFGTITLEGGENETGCILTLKLVKIEAGFDTLNVNHEERE